MKKHNIKTIFFSLILFSLLSVFNVFAQTEGTKPGVAVLPFSTSGYINSGASVELSDLLIDELVNSNRLRVVDRDTTEKAADIEKIKALSGEVSSATAAEIGQKTGAQFLVVGRVTELGEEGTTIVFATSYKATLRFNLRVVHTTTGEIVFSKSFEKTGSGLGALKNVPGGSAFKSKAMKETINKSMKEASEVIIEKISSFAPVSNPASPSPSSQISTNSVTDCSRYISAKAPKIMVIIPEIHITQKIPDPAGETEIIKKLVAQRFNIVDQRQVAAIRDREKVLTALKNPQAAAALGIEFGADIIIIGEAFSELATRQNGMISTRARVEARAIQTDNARILAADGKFGSGLDIAEFVSAKAALRNAGSSWADYFTAQVCQVPLNNEPISSTIEIMISNITFTQLKQVSDQLAKISGVKSVEKKLTGNVARIDIQYSNNAEKLADAISETKFGLLRVNIVGLSGNKIEISIGK